MCNLCSPDEKKRKAAREYCGYIAERLNRLAGYYERMSDGLIKPHTEQAAAQAVLARNLIRDLVEEWI